MFDKNPEIELIYEASKYFTNHDVYYEVASFHRSMDILLVDPLGCLIAIEAKISNWKKAIEQVTTHALTCDYLFLLMPEKKTQNAKMFNTLIEKGIGLLLLNDNNLDMPIKPIKSNLIWKPQRKIFVDRLKDRELKEFCPWDFLNEGVHA